MDDRRFDAVSRAWGTSSGQSRRRLLGAVLGAAVASVWTRFGGTRNSLAQGDECPAGQTLCVSATAIVGCFDLSSDLNHCGACFAVCESGLVGVRCTGGVCERASCPVGLEYCGAVDLCQDIATSPFHCGGCGIACGSGVCEGGFCVPAGGPPAPDGCLPPRTLCGDPGGYTLCLDLQTNSAACGGCDNVCVDAICSGGTCVPSPGLCAPGFSICPNLNGPPSCFDLARDPTSCGACYNSCPPGVACVDGVCGGAVCPAGQTNCGTAATPACADLATDTQNCAACGNVCATNAICNGAGCVCRDGLTYCAAQRACRDLTLDRANCGGCDNACRASQVCENGACTSGPPAASPGQFRIAWPFDEADGAAPWTVLNGYRGEGSHARRPDGSANYLEFALDLARCDQDRVDARQNQCLLAEGGLLATGADRVGWDTEATRGTTVLSPVDGTIAWVDRSPAGCLAVGIDIADAPGYRLALFHVEGYPTSGYVRQGLPIGTVAEEGCGPGDRIEMALYRIGDEPDDPASEREGVPFADEWAIADCDFPDDERTENQYRGELVPCR